MVVVITSPFAGGANNYIRLRQVTFTVTWKAMITPHSMTPEGAAAFPGVVPGPQGRPNEVRVAVPR